MIKMEANTEERREKSRGGKKGVRSVRKEEDRWRKREKGEGRKIVRGKQERRGKEGNEREKEEGSGRRERWK